MPKDGVEFKGRIYVLRHIDFGEDWGNYFVGSTHLEHLLINEDMSYTCECARYVDELIFYFVPAYYFKLSDDELRDKILEEIV